MGFLMKANGERQSYIGASSEEASSILAQFRAVRNDVEAITETDLKVMSASIHL